MKKLIFLIKTTDVLTAAYLVKCFHMAGPMSDTAATQILLTQTFLGIPLSLGSTLPLGDV